MDIRPVAFLDSGVGGLSYCADFLSHAPHESLVYVADRAHFPYGPRSREELSSIVCDVVGRMIERFTPKLVAIVCNSASVSALDDLRTRFPQTPFVGTVPAIKTAAAVSRRRSIGLLATERTVSDPYITSLCSRFAPDCELHSIAAPELVEFVERDYPHASPERRREVVTSFVDRFKALGVDTIVLACTHFCFLADDFRAICGDELSVFDSRDGVARRAVALLEESGSLSSEDLNPCASRRLYVTGSEPFEPDWKTFGDLFSMEFSGSLEGGR